MLAQVKSKMEDATKAAAKTAELAVCILSPLFAVTAGTIVAAKVRGRALGVYR